MIALAIVAAYLLGLATALTPALVQIAVDRQVHIAQKRDCKDKGLDGDHCEFSAYYDDYKASNPTLDRIDGFFLPNEDVMAFVLSGRCTNWPMHNVSALGRKSGKVSRREYFGSPCQSDFAVWLSDTIYGASAQEPK